MKYLSSGRVSPLAKTALAAILLSVSGFAPALTMYTATLDAALISPPAVNNQYGFASFAGSGSQNGSSFGVATDSGSTSVYNMPLRVGGIAHVEGTTDVNGGESIHSASTSGHLNLGNLSGPGNPDHPTPQPYTVQLLLSWSYTITVTCSLDEEIATATVSASVPGGGKLDPVSLYQAGPGTQTVTIKGSTMFDVTIPGYSTKAMFLDVHVDGNSVTSPVPEPGTFAALGLGLLALRRRKR